MSLFFESIAALRTSKKGEKMSQISEFLRLKILFKQLLSAGVGCTSEVGFCVFDYNIIQVFFVCQEFSVFHSA